MHGIRIIYIFDFILFCGCFVAYIDKLVRILQCLQTSTIFVYIMLGVDFLTIRSLLSKEFDSFFYGTIYFYLVFMLLYICVFKFGIYGVLIGTVAA